MTHFDGRNMSRKTRNVTVSGHRTSLRLTDLEWTAIEEIARRENTNINALCTHIDRRRGDMPLAAAIRVFMLMYFKDAATEQGHNLARHGSMMTIQRVAVGAYR